MSLGEAILSKCFQIRNYEIKSVIKEEARIVLELERIGPSYCSQCGTIGGRYDSSIQEILISSLNTIAVYARVKIWRVRCYRHQVVTEAHGISEGKKRHSKAVEQAVIRFTEKLDNQAAAELLGISSMTIYRIDIEGLLVLQEKYLEELPRPASLSVDEISYKRRHRHASVISDYQAGKVLWLEKGRTEADLKRGYAVLGNSLTGTDSVSMDLWKAFENATKESLPQARVVYDKFHISRLLNRAIEDERRRYQNTLFHEDRKLMKKHSRCVGYY